MQILARLELDRSDRVAVVRATTLRDDIRSPSDVVLENLSTTGCLINVEFDLKPGAVVSIGLPGIGACFAKVVRCDRPNYGCEFLVPISEKEISLAQSADSVVRVAFARPPMAFIPALEIDQADGSGLSFAGKAAIIASASIVLWMAIAAAIVMIRR